MRVCKIKIECCDYDRLKNDRVETFDMIVESTENKEEKYYPVSLGCDNYSDRENCLKCLERFKQLCKDFNSDKIKFSNFEIY